MDKRQALDELHDLADGWRVDHSKTLPTAAMCANELEAWTQTARAALDEEAPLRKFARRVHRFARMEPVRVTWGEPATVATAPKIHYFIKGKHDGCCPLWFPELRQVFGRLLGRSRNE